MEKMENGYSEMQENVLYLVKELNSFTEYKLM